MNNGFGLQCGIFLLRDRLIQHTMLRRLVKTKFTLQHIEKSIGFLFIAFLSVFMRRNLKTIQAEILIACALSPWIAFEFGGLLCGILPR